MVPPAEMARRPTTTTSTSPATSTHPSLKTFKTSKLTCTAASPTATSIPLSVYWAAFPHLRLQLFKPNRPGYSDLAVDVNEVQQAILDSAEFKDFTVEVRDNVEYAPRGIRINAICPGTIETPMVTDMIAKGELDMTEAVATSRSPDLAGPTKSPRRWCGCAVVPEPASSSASPYPWTAAIPQGDHSNSRPPISANLMDLLGGTPRG
jgi:hypothetical protein